MPDFPQMTRTDGLERERGGSLPGNLHTATPPLACGSYQPGDRQAAKSPPLNQGGAVQTRSLCPPPMTVVEMEICICSLPLPPYSLAPPSIRGPETFPATALGHLAHAARPALCIRPTRHPVTARAPFPGWGMPEGTSPCCCGGHGASLTSPRRRRTVNHSGMTWWGGHIASSPILDLPKAPPMVEHASHPA